MNFFLLEALIFNAVGRNPVSESCLPVTTCFKEKSICSMMVFICTLISFDTGYQINNSSLLAIRFYDLLTLSLLYLCLWRAACAFLVVNAFLSIAAPLLFGFAYCCYGAAQVCILHHIQTRTDCSQQSLGIKWYLVSAYSMAAVHAQLCRPSTQSQAQVGMLGFGFTNGTDAMWLRQYLILVHSCWYYQ